MDGHPEPAAARERQCTVDQRQAAVHRQHGRAVLVRGPRRGVGVGGGLQVGGVGLQ